MSEYVVKAPAQLAQLWKGKRALLSRLDIELTERCNNNCMHCYINRPANDEEAQQREMSTRDVQNILVQAAGLGCLSVRFTGGEPLLRPDFADLYVSARRLGLKVLLFTNATLITPEIADLFARIPPLEKIEVSVYGMSRRSYDAVSRSPGMHELAWRGINLLLDRKIPFVAKGPVLPATRGEIDEFEAWARALPGSDDYAGHSMYYDLRCRRDSDKKNALIRRLRLSPEEGLRLLTRDPAGYRKGMREFAAKFMSVPGDKLFVCGAGFGGCVDAYGMLQPCMMLRHPDTVYHLRQGSLADALTVFFPTMREMRASNPDYLARCARCFLKSLCEQCPAKSWMEHGALDTPVEYQCEIAHAQARWLGLVGESENAWKVVDWRERLHDFARGDRGDKEQASAY